MPHKENGDEAAKVPKTNEDTILSLRSKISENELLLGTAELFKVFGDKTRLRIIYALTFGELCVRDIAKALKMTISAISHQLRVLRQARVISWRREGKSVIYMLSDEHIYSIFFAASEHINEKQAD